MGFFYGLFWTKERIDRIGPADVDKLENQRALAEVALRHSDSYVRMHAVKKLDNEAVLAKVAVNRKENGGVCELAVNRMTNEALLADAAKNSWWLPARLAAVRKIRDERFLRDLAEIPEKTSESEGDWETKHWNSELTRVQLESAIQLADKKLAAEIVKTRAVYPSYMSERELRAVYPSDMRAVDLLDDEEALAAIAKKSSGDEDGVRLAALRKVTDKGLLADIAARGQFLSISKVATKMLEGDERMLAQVAKEDGTCSYESVELLTDDVLLTDVAQNAKLPEVRLKAARRIHDQRLADKIRVEIASSEKNSDLWRYEAVSELNNAEEMARFAMGENYYVAARAVLHLSDPLMLRKVAEGATVVRVRLEAAEKLGDQSLVETYRQVIRTEGEEKRRGEGFLPCILCGKEIRAMGGHNTVYHQGKTYACCTGGCGRPEGAYDSAYVGARIERLSDEERSRSEVPANKTLSKENEVDYTNFIADFTVAFKAGDMTKIRQLMTQYVQCTFCKSEVKAIATAQNLGQGRPRLVCPQCGREWIRIG